MSFVHAEIERLSQIILLKAQTPSNVHTFILIHLNHLCVLNFVADAGDAATGMLFAGGLTRAGDRGIFGAGE